MRKESQWFKPRLKLPNVEEEVLVRFMNKHDQIEMAFAVYENGKVEKAKSRWWWEYSEFNRAEVIPNGWYITQPCHDEVIQEKLPNNCKVLHWISKTDLESQIGGGLFW